jgi:pyruvate/2-oxoglutarate dehydrogenase complex dihydrolipoamide dehydrogenase (E3) component
MRHRDHGGRHRVLIDSHSDRMLGFAAFGPEPGELMPNVQVAMLADVPYTLLRDAVFTHPTMTEGLGMLFARVPSNATRQSRNAITCK